MVGFVHRPICHRTNWIRLFSSFKIFPNSQSTPLVRRNLMDHCNVQKRMLKTKLEKFLRQRNTYPEDELQYEHIPQRVPDSEEFFHRKAWENIQMEKDGNDERNIGPYPRLSHSSYINRDPNEPWDFPQERRNFGEPVPYDYDILGTNMMDHLDDTPLWHSLAIISGLSCVIGGIIWGAKIINDHWNDWFQQNELLGRITGVPVIDAVIIQENEKLVNKYRVV